MTHGTGEIKTSPSGRKFQRHISDKGTIMEWRNRDGDLKHTLILDAAYRHVYQFISSASKDVGLDTHIKGGYISSTGLPEDYKDINPEHFKDAYLNGLDIVLQDTSSSTDNTDVLLLREEYDNVAKICRDIYIVEEDKSADLPNIDVLARIYGDTTIIDGMDPTINADHFEYFYTNQEEQFQDVDEKNFVVWTTPYEPTNPRKEVYPVDFIFSLKSAAWSSTYFGDSGDEIRSSLLLDNTGKVTGTLLQYYKQGIIPIVEMD